MDAKVQKYLFKAVFTVSFFPFVWGMIYDRRGLTTNYWVLLGPFLMSLLAHLERYSQKRYPPQTLFIQCMEYLLIFLIGLILFNGIAILCGYPFNPGIVGGNIIAVSLAVTLIAIIAGLNYWPFDSASS